MWDNIRLIIFLSLLIRNGYLAFAGHEHRAFHFLVFIVFGSFFALSIAAARDPEAVWVAWLFKKKHGPRTDTASMTRRELLQSGTTFLVWSVLAFGALTAVGQWGGFESDNPSILAMSLLFAGTLIFLILLGSSMVLLLRGLLKKDIT